MNNPEDRKTIDSIRSLKEIEPSEQSIQRALNRVQATSEGMNRSTHIASTHNKQWRTPMTTKIATGILALTGLIILTAGLLPNSVDPASAFAETQEKLANVKSMTFTIITKTTGKSDITQHVKILGKNRVRMDRSDVETQIMDLNQNKMLRLQHKEKKATLMKGFIPKQASTFFDVFLNVEEHSIEKLPDRVIDGKKTNGFVIDDNGRKMKIWIDAQTKLPVRGETIVKISDEIEIREIMTDIVFDNELDEKLFVITSPSDYAVEYRTLRTPTKNEIEKTASLIVTSKIGIGKAKFGMTREEVIEALGKPDEVRNHKGGTSLSYMSRGFQLGFDQQKGTFRSIGLQAAHKTMTFKGKTKEGIRMKASGQDIIDAYGKPSFDNSNKTQLGKMARIMAYPELGLQFSLIDDSLTMLNVYVPPTK